MIAVVTYSTDNFETMRKLNVKTAYSKGKADIVFEFTPNDIDKDFKEKNKRILSNTKGAGLWLWKPYVIKKALALIKDGEYLIYGDAASFYTNRIDYLVNALELSGQDIMVFELPLITKQWTKQETIVRMHCENRGFEEKNQIQASFILLKKTQHSINFIKEYLVTCCDEAIISQVQFDKKIINSEDYITHRFDQSILSILSMKYGLKPFRDPSQYGKRPWEYILSKEVIYRPKIYNNSKYPTIFQLTRKEINNWYMIKEKLKMIFSLIPLYKQWEITRRKRRISKI